MGFEQRQARTRMKNQRQRQTQQTTRVCWLRAEDRPSTQIAKVFCGKAFVSILSRRCPLVRIRSLGHRPFVYGTTAQYKLATSTYPTVVRNTGSKTTKARKRAQRQRPSWPLNVEKKAKFNSEGLF